MTPSTTNIFVKKTALALFILAIAFIGSVLYVSQDKSEHDVLIPAEELMSLYEKLNELDFELTEKEKELEEFKATSLDFELSLDEPEEEPSLSSKGHVQKKKDFQRELKKTKKKKADKKSKEVTQQGGRNGMSKLAYEVSNFLWRCDQRIFLRSHYQQEYSDCFYEKAFF